MTLIAENYFDDKFYYSVSAYKRFKSCEASSDTEFKMTTAMLIGSYVDAYVEGTLDKFKEDYPEIFSTRGVSKGELKGDFKYANEICDFIDNDKILSQFLSGEKQVVMVGEIAQIPFKIMVDSLSRGVCISDLKVMASVTDRNGEYYNFISSWGYDIQMACYQEIVRQNTGEQLPCYIVAVTKESPINSVVVNIPQNILDSKLYEVQSDIQRAYTIKMGVTKPISCGRCNTCISNRKETPIISMSDFIDFM